jgi:hypothetical protein
MPHSHLKKHFAIALSLFMLSGISVLCFTQLVQADAPRKAPARAVKRAPAPQHHHFVDSRYKHNHSYPARGRYFRELPRDHRVVMHNHSRYYSSHGVWYRPYHGRYVVVAPPVGLFVPFLPLAYTTIWLSGIPYYYANDTYYTQTAGGYVVVEPPQGEVSETPPGTEQQDQSAENKMFIYPRKGQSEKQQADDRYECHTWAVGQTNYDPTRNPSGIPVDQIMQKRSEYQRAMASCLDARGYTAK